MMRLPHSIDRWSSLNSNAVQAMAAHWRLGKRAQCRCSRLPRASWKLRWRSPA